METVSATFHNGRIELAEPVNWPDGTQVKVTPLGRAQQPVSWLSLPPFEVGQFRELNTQDDLLAEMLDESRA